jgi:hypothetical protein
MGSKSRGSSQRKSRSGPFTPRWKPALNTLEIAASKASRLSPDVVASLRKSLNDSLGDLTRAERSQVAWRDLRMACVMSRRVEVLGVVKGLGGVIDAGFVALDAIRERSMGSGEWRHCIPSDRDLAALREMAHCHVFQLEHLSAGEFERALLAARSEMAAMPRLLSPSLAA